MNGRFREPGLFLRAVRCGRMRRAGLALITLFVAALAAAPARAAVPACDTPGFVSTWGASPSDSVAPPLENQTVRMIVAPHLAGTVLRIHVSNRFGDQSITIGPVTIGETATGAAVKPGTLRSVTFNGHGAAVTIPAGAELTSDSVRMPVRPFTDMTVSVDVPGTVRAPTEHYTTRQTNYLSSPGEHASEEDGASFRSTTDTSAKGWYFLTGIDVAASAKVGAVAAFGDSITDGFQGMLSPVNEDLTYIDQNLRYPDYLARRLIAAGWPLSVLNAGISGNRVLENGQIPQFGPPGVERVKKDVIGQPGVADAIVLEGINDIGQTSGITADALEKGLAKVVGELHAAKLRVLLGTLTPAGGTAVPAYGGAAGNALRVEVNRWIRSQRVADAVVDFDAAVRDPSDPSRLAPQYDGGDHLHLSPAGYERMAKAVPLAQLHAPRCATPRKHSPRKRIRLTVNPRVMYASNATVLGFHVSRRVGSRNIPVARALVRFRGRHRRTGRDGLAIMHVRVPRPGVYTARASWRTARSTVRVRVKPAPRGG
jgi:lysophospholipase L1-like esterase